MDFFVKEMLHDRGNGRREKEDKFFEGSKASSHGEYSSKRRGIQSSQKVVGCGSQLSSGRGETRIKRETQRDPLPSIQTAHELLLWIICKYIIYFDFVHCTFCSSLLARFLAYLRSQLRLQMRPVRITKVRLKRIRRRFETVRERNLKLIRSCK